jgi:DNA-binding NarL/FixJ family response regulator
MDGLRAESGHYLGGNPQVLLAIASPLMRTAAEACLQERGFGVRWAGADAAVVIESAVQDLPDVVVIDTDLPGGGLMAATKISSAAPGIAVVMLAHAPTEADVLAAIHAGAVGYLPKDVSLEGLTRALRGVLVVEPALPRKLVSALLDEIRGADVRLLLGRPHEALPDLTLRELEVLRLLARGASTLDIARALSISPITVRRHCTGICKKLNVQDRATAVEMVKRSRLPLGSHVGWGSGRPVLTTAAAPEPQTGS